MRRRSWKRWKKNTSDWRRSVQAKRSARRRALQTWPLGWTSWRRSSTRRTNVWRQRSMLPSRVLRRCSSNSWRPDLLCTPHPPPASPRDTFPAVSVLLPILGDEPRSAAKEKEASSPKLTPQVGGRASPPVPVAHCTSPRTHLEEMLASTIVDTAATEAGPSSSVASEQPVQVLQT
jgi:hypothetical protein